MKNIFLNLINLSAICFIFANFAQGADADFYIRIRCKGGAPTGEVISGNIKVTYFYQPDFERTTFFFKNGTFGVTHRPLIFGSEYTMVLGESNQQNLCVGPAMEEYVNGKFLPTINAQVIDKFIDCQASWQNMLQRGYRGYFSRSLTVSDGQNEFEMSYGENVTNNGSWYLSYEECIQANKNWTSRN